ncbi:AMP-binding protein, partial [bacterium]|nr:AMP-binding protein [bacterium]
MHEKTSSRSFDRPGLTIPELLIRGASEAPAILAPDRKEITFGELRQQVYALAQDLASFRLGGKRIAIVMENGPDLVLSLLAAATCGVAVPLNPKYRESDFSFFYEDANVKGLIAVPDTVPEAFAAAPSGTVVVNAVVDGSDPLRFESINPEPSGGSLKIPLPHDVTLLLHTSGTTKRPKSVPIRHRNVAASATNIVNAYDLTLDDRSLCVMPLFHIHGIVASLLGPLAAG